MTEPLLMVVGGGTGGHVYPGVAVCQAWIARGGRVIYVGSPKGMEARVVPELGYDFVPIEARRLKNAGTIERLRSLLSMPSSIWAGSRVIKKYAPQVVLGVGGYISGPVMLAAALCRKPCAIAEQNAKPGLTNRILAKFVQRVYSAFPEIADQLGQKVRMLGNPVRTEIRDAAKQASPAGQSQHILIIGGSQGAKALNEKLPPVLAALRDTFPEMKVRHQTGRNKDAPVREAYANADFIEASVEPFIDDMAAAITWADLVVARAGATTVAELACVGRPALFVPFPYAADDHQAANAASLVKGGAAIMAREETLDAARLQAMLTELLEAPDRLAEMGRCAQVLSHPNAADAIVDDLLSLMEAQS